jgi:hypothetical protein
VPDEGQGNKRYNQTVKACGEHLFYRCFFIKYPGLEKEPRHKKIKYIHPLVEMGGSKLQPLKYVS